jgi:hypothetical protein
MGHIITPKFELQLEQKNGKLLCIGVNSLKEAKENIIAYKEYNPTEMSGKCYLWGNSAAGKNYLNSHNADYWQIDFYTLKTELCGIPIEY